MILEGGNMDRPVLKDGRVHKKISANSHTIHGLLLHLRKSGVDWVPESYGIDENGRHAFYFIPGEVPQENPSWLWAEDILKDAACKLRQLHDASSDFTAPAESCWQLPVHRPVEVICHNDFAPYNCVFADGGIRGVIDFDVSSPGPRIWDIAYTVYRFVPLYPEAEDAGEFEASPFSSEEMRRRLLLFLREYGLEYEKRQDEVLRNVRVRLLGLAEWTDDFAVKTGREELRGHAALYRDHAERMPI